jgi:hypothetical protein
MPQRIINVDEVSKYLDGQQKPSSGIQLVREAPLTPGMPEGFTANLKQEYEQGVEKVKGGGIVTPVLGGMQAVTAPLTAAARTAGQATQDVAMSMGMGPTASAIPATIVDTAVQVLGGPLLGRVARSTAQGLARILPGLSGASSMAKRTLISEAAQSIPSKVKPLLTSAETEQIYEKVGNISTRIPTTQLEGIVTKLADVEAKVGNVAGKTLQSAPIRNITEELSGVMQEAKAQGGLPFNELRMTLKRLNERIQGTPPEARDELYGAYMQLKRGIFEDMENTRVLYKQGGMNKDAYTELRRADAAYRVESATEDLSHFVSQATRVEKGNLAFNADSVLTKIRRNEFFRDSIPKEDLKSITDTLESVSRRMPARPQSGLGRIGMAGAEGAGASMLASLTGVGPALTAPAFAGGMGGIAGMTIVADAVIGKAMMTRPGQVVLRKLFEKDRWITPEKLAALSGITRHATEYANMLTKPADETVDIPAQ